MLILLYFNLSKSFNGILFVIEYLYTGVLLSLMRNILYCHNSLPVRRVFSLNVQIIQKQELSQHTPGSVIMTTSVHRVTMP